MLGTVKAYSRTSGKLIAAWPVKIAKHGLFYATDYPFLTDNRGGEGFATMKDAADSIPSGNDWVRIEVEWQS